MYPTDPRGSNRGTCAASSRSTIERAEMTLAIGLTLLLREPAYVDREGCGRRSILNLISDDTSEFTPKGEIEAIAAGSRRCRWN